jgi:hypothetical protein
MLPSSPAHCQATITLHAGNTAALSRTTELKSKMLIGKSSELHNKRSE